MIKLLRNRMLAVAALLLPAMAWSQVTQITFVVPVNLTNLRPEILDVSVQCLVHSLQGNQQISFARAVSNTVPAVNGRVIAELQVVVDVVRIDDPSTETGRYACSLQGGTRRGPNNTYQVDLFKANHADPIFRLPVAAIAANFSWLQP